MKPLIYSSLGLVASDICVGPGKFARFENEQEPVNMQSSDQVVATNSNITHRVWGVLSDMNTHGLRKEPVSFHDYDLLHEEDEQDDPFGEKLPKQRCSGGCPPTDKKSELDGLLTVAEKTGDIKQVAREKAENDISLRQEFLQGITIHFASYEKKSSTKWENKGRDLVDLVEEERRDRYKALKQNMNGAQVGIVFSEPTTDEDFNYLQIFFDSGDEIEMYAIEHRGNLDDLKRVYEALAEEARDSQYDEASFVSTPLYFQEGISFTHIAQTIEENFSSDESRAHSQDYLSRLHRDVASVSLIEDYQKEAEKLAQQIEQEILSSETIQQGIAAIVWGVDVQIETLTQTSEHLDQRVRESTTGAPEYVQYPDKNSDTHAHIGPARSKDVNLFADIFNRYRVERISDLLIKEPVEFFSNQADLNMAWEKIVRETPHYTPEQSEELFKEVQEKWMKKEEDKEVISIVNETGVGIGAAVYLVGEWARLGMNETQETMLGAKEKISYEKPTINTLTDEIFTQWRETETEIPLIAFISETGVGIAAAPVFIENMKLEKDFDEETFIVLDELFEFVDGKPFVPLQLTQNEKDNVFSLFVSESTKDEVTPMSFIEASIIPSEVDVTTLVETIEFVRTVDQLDSKLQETAIEQEQESVEEKIVHLWEMIHVTVLHQTDRQDQRSASVHRPTEPIALKEETDEKEQTQVKEFSFAISVWMFLRLVNYRFTLVQLGKFIHETKNVDKNISLSARIRKEQPEGLIQKESGQWILFAIIWYLAMIREQGLIQATGNMKQATGKKKKKAKEVLIFLYARDMITV